MIKIISLLLIGVFLSPFSVDARSSRTSPDDVYVQGYCKKNGKCTKGYYRTKPNSTKKDNYSCYDYGRCK